MKFLICGLGSIGQRHVRVLREIFGQDCDIAAYRRRHLSIVINDDMTAQENVSPEEHYGLRVFNDFDEAMRDGPDAVFVTNPISMHVETALAAARHGAHLFIEKPLGHALEGVEALRQEAADQSLITMVGYQLRYHPMLLKVRALLEVGTIGRVISADIHFGEWPRQSRY